MSNSEGSFDLGFHDLIVWVENRGCCGPKKIKEEKKDSKENSKLKSQEDSDLKPEDTSKPEDDSGSGTEEKTNVSIGDMSNFLDDHLMDESHGKAILKNIRGLIKSSEMTAIIGPSGSGKTTLLNFLSSRSNWDSNMFVDGQLTLNGQVMANLSKYKHLIGFVPQEDILITNGTIRDNLETYGILRGASNYRKKAQNLIQEFDLEKCAETLVGTDSIRGISGGEKKRTSIAVELMSDPKVLFLDEPTTGIDSFNALNVIEVLKRLNTERGLGVVSVMHQPRKEIIDLFDQVGSG